MRRKCISWWMTDVSWHFFLIFSHWLWWSNWRRFLRRRLQLIRRSTLGLPNDRFSIKVKMSSNMNTTGIINLKGSIELFSFSAKHIAIYILSAPMSPPPPPSRKWQDHFVSSDSDEGEQIQSNIHFISVRKYSSAVERNCWAICSVEWDFSSVFDVDDVITDL